MSALVLKFFADCENYLPFQRIYGIDPIGGQLDDLDPRRGCFGGGNEAPHGCDEAARELAAGHSHMYLLSAKGADPIPAWGTRPRNAVMTKHER